MDHYEANEDATESDQEMDGIWRAEFKARIDKWMAEDLFTAESIKERLTFWAERRIDENEGGRDYFRSLFESHSKGSSFQNWDSGALTSFLQDQFPGSFRFVEEAGPVLFTSLAYLSTVPFATEVLSTLTYGDLARAVAILLPEKSPLNRPSFQDPFVIRRERTTVDDRRLFFRSLAVSTQELPSDGQTVSNDAPLFDDPLSEDFTNMEPSSYFVDVSAEDEDVTDILDVLAATQPGQGRGVAQVPRAWFAEVAETLSGSKVKLNQLRIPRPRMLILLKFLLITQLETPGTAIDHFGEHVPELEKIANCLLEAFLTTDGTGVSWPMFNNIIAKSLPLLLEPLYRFAELLFTPPTHLRRPIHLGVSNSGEILTLPMLSQLRCFLPKSVSLYRSQQLYAKAPSNTANDLVEAASSWRGPSVLLVSASTPYRLNTVHLKALKDSRVDTETSVFGVFISQPWQTAPGTCFVSTGGLLCQLAPIHEVFPAAEHGKNGKKHAVFTQARDLVFGEAFGGRLSLDHELAKGNFTRELSEQRSYEDNSGLGQSLQSEIELSITSLEVWGLK